MPRILNINKDLIPYEFEISLNDTLYTFGVGYNTFSDTFHVDLASPTEDLVTGENLTLNKPMFLQMYDDGTNTDIRYPQDIIMALDTSGNETRVGWEQLQNTIFVYVSTREELGLTG